MHSNNLVPSLFALASLATSVLGHGMMTFPLSRLNATDVGFKDTVNTNKKICHGLPASKTPSGVISNAVPLNVNWAIFIPHNGSCEFSISYDGSSNFEKVAVDPKCASSKALYKASINLPKDKTSDNAVIRWAYLAGNGETYESCSDVKIVAGNAEANFPKVTPSSLDAPAILNITAVKEKGLLTLTGAANDTTDGPEDQSGKGAGNGSNSASAFSPIVFVALFAGFFLLH